MEDAIQLGPLYTKGWLTFFFVTLNCLLQAKVFKSPIDWDSAAHLYFAYLRWHKIPFISSYSLGIKYILPRLYSIMMPYINGAFHQYRLANIISSSLIIALLVFSSPMITANSAPMLLALVLLMNSLWVNYATSAIEFHSSLFFLSILFVPQFILFPFSLYVQVILLCVLIALFKITDSVFILPVIFMAWEGHPEALLTLIVCTAYTAAFALFVIKRQSSSPKTYIKTRGYLHVKNVFVLANPIFIVLMAWLVILNFAYNSLMLKSLIFSALLMIVVQKMFIAYIFYPLLIVCFYGMTQGRIGEEVSLGVLWCFAGSILVFHTLPHILFLSPKSISIRYRSWFLLNFGYRKFLEQREEQVEWLRDNLIVKENIYLWGSNVNLLLLAELRHSPNTFYSHNHLFYWSSIKDKRTYVVNYVKRYEPAYIIEAGIIEGCKFPEDVFSKEYSLVKTFYDMKVYKNISINKKGKL